MIRFVNSIDEIQEQEPSRTILVDDSLQSKRALIDRIEGALEAPYEKDDWDGFKDALSLISEWCTLSVALIHKSLPALTGWDLKTYLEILEEASGEWDAMGGEQTFTVYFLLADKAKVDFFLPGKFPEPKVKKQRAPATRIGDIFEIPLPVNIKRFMQFVTVDSSQLGAWCVRVFKTEYSMDARPSVEDIVKDDVDFCCNTRAIGHGTQFGLWSYYGKSSDLGDLNKIVFRTFHRSVPDVPPQRWRVWTVSQKARHYRVLPRRYLKTDDGGMCPPIWVLYRIIHGRWMPVPNVIDDYKGASLLSRLLGRENIPEHLAPKN